MNNRKTSRPQRLWFQRLLVAGSILSLIFSLTFLPDRDTNVASAAVECGPGDANRASLQTAGGQTMRPCLSKVNLRVHIPGTSYSCGIFGWSTCWEEKWTISGVGRSGLQTVRYADGTTEQLYRLTFREFRPQKDLTLSTTNGSGYTLTLKPDGPAKLGGAGSTGATVITDMWVTPNSSMRFDFSLLGLGFTCASDTRIDNSLLALTGIIGVNVFGCSMDLQVRYLVTTAETGSITGQYSVNLPDTTVTVTP